MRATIAALLGIILLGVTLTGVVAATQGQSQDQGHKRRSAACRFTNSPVVTVTGTIRDLVVPAAGSRQGAVRFTLVSGTTTTTVRLGPSRVLQTAGVTLTNGDTVTVTGWSVTKNGNTRLITRELTVNGKTITLRNADGTPTWQQGRGKHKRGTGAGSS